MWCRLFRSVLAPSWVRDAQRARTADEAWLAAREESVEVLSPADFVGCDCGSYQAADLDDHEPACGARVSVSVPVDGAETSPTVGEAETPPLWGASRLLDHIAELILFHTCTFEGLAYVTCSCGWVLYMGPWDKPKELHAAHQAQVVLDMVAADRRMSTAKQQMETGHDMGLSAASELFPQHRKAQK